MSAFRVLVFGVLAALAGCQTRYVPASNDIVLENAACRLVLGADAAARSLVIKATGEECLDAREGVPFLTATQDRPFNNEIKLIHPNRQTTYPATSVRLEGETLVFGFAHRMYEARVRVKRAAGYLAFTLEDLPSDRPKTYDYLKMDIPPVATLRLVQLPVRNRKNFGDWLNAAWDDTAAVAVVGNSPHADIDHTDRPGFRNLHADLRAEIGLRGKGASIVATSGKETFLDAMDALECDFNLPRGVQSRRSNAVREPIFHLSGPVNFANIDRIIAYAKAGGFKLMTFNYSHIVKEKGSWRLCGDYDWREDVFPNHEADLRRMLAKVKAAGITPGIHTMHSHIGLESRYVTPVADARLNKTRRFTLAQTLPTTTNDIAELAVQEPTEGTVLFPACRILQFGGELLSYTNYTHAAPYRFLGVKRGALNTCPAAHPKGEVGGILDISEFGSPGSCYLDQNSDLQDEVAAKLAKIYNCGFEYLYLDGSEGVNRPFNYHVANAQLRFWRTLEKAPLFGEGAAKTHFGWHMLAGANAFDCFSPEIFKEKLREFPFKQAPITAQDMSRVDFGWWGFWAPGKNDWWQKKLGVQADMWEYGASVSVAWNCAMSILMPLAQLDAHPRTADILETMRRWNEVSRRGLVTDAWRAELKHTEREHHLIRLADGAYDLVTYRQLALPPDSPVRAFVFTYAGATCVVYWDGAGSGSLQIPLDPAACTLLDEFAGKKVSVSSQNGSVILPAGNRLYLKATCAPEVVERAFRESVYAKMKGK